VLIFNTKKGKNQILSFLLQVDFGFILTPIFKFLAENLSSVFQLTLRSQITFRSIGCPVMRERFLSIEPSNLAIVAVVSNKANCSKLLEKAQEGGIAKSRSVFVFTM
jgi:hypothetical protein